MASESKANMSTKLKKSVLLLRVVLYSWNSYASFLLRALKSKPAKPAHDSNDPHSVAAAKAHEEARNIVIIGASYAGYHAARLLATSLPASSPYRVVIIEPNSHFQFTWVLPRFCVVKDHEHKAFIPYGPYLQGADVRWVRDRAASVGKNSVKLGGSGEEIGYEFLVVATGSGAGDELPSRVGVDDREEGMERLRGVQGRIERAGKVVVVGGGAAGVELAADAKGLYPHKAVRLVHSRPAVMNRFGPELQAAALKHLENLGVKVLLGERVMEEDQEAGTVTLKSGAKLEADCIINCTGQKPNSSIISTLSPSSIAEDGYVKIKPTLQIDDDALPNIYLCGDVARTGERNPNARSAMRAAMVVADNILLATKGKATKNKYKPHWADAVIKLTLGLENSITHFSDGKTELLFDAKESDLALMSAQCWRNLGATPFDDTGVVATEQNRLGSA